MPNGDSEKKEACLTYTETRPEYLGEECVWCEGCEIHQCEVKSVAVLQNHDFEDCSPTKGTDTTGLFL